MPKARPQDVTAMGFVKSQFGDPPQWDTTNGYIGAIVNDVALEVEAKLGTAIYAAATEGTLNFKRIRKAEVYFTVAEMWRRMEQFQATQAALARSESAPPSIESRLLKNAQEAEATAWAELALIDPSIGAAPFSIGHVETGPYPAARV